MGINYLKALPNVVEEFEINDKVVVYLWVEDEVYVATRIDELYSIEVHTQLQNDPSYKTNEKTTFYVCCGTVIKIFKNGEVGIKIECKLND